MWKCVCGKDCNDNYNFCSACGGKKEDATQTSTVEALKKKTTLESSWLKNEDIVYPWAIALLGPIWTFITTSLTDLFVLNISSILSGGSHAIVGLIIVDALNLKKKGIKFTKETVLGCLLLPSIYLWGRAKATDGNKWPAIIRFSFEVFEILLTIIAVILTFIAPYCLRP